MPVAVATSYKLLKVQGNAYTDLRKRLERDIQEKQVELERELELRSAARQKEQILLDLVVQSEVTLKLLGASRANQLPSSGFSAISCAPSCNSDCETISCFDDGISSRPRPALRGPERQLDLGVLAAQAAAAESAFLPPPLLPQQQQQPDATSASSFIARLLQGATREQVVQVCAMTGADWCAYYRVCFARLLLLLEVATREDDSDDEQACEAPQQAAAADAYMSDAAPLELPPPPAPAAAVDAAVCSWDADTEMFLAAGAVDTCDDVAWLFAELVERDDSSTSSGAPCSAIPGSSASCFAAFAPPNSCATTPSLQPGGSPCHGFAQPATPALQPGQPWSAGCGSAATTPSPCGPPAGSAASWGASMFQQQPPQLQLQQFVFPGPDAVAATPAAPATPGGCSSGPALPGASPASDMQQLELLVSEWTTLTLLAHIYNPRSLYEAAALNHVTQMQQAARPRHWQRVARELELSDSQALHVGIGLQQYLRMRAAATSGQAALASAATDVDALLRELGLPSGAQAAGGTDNGPAAALEQLGRSVDQSPLHDVLLLGVFGNTLTPLQLAKAMVASYPFMPLAGAISESLVALHTSTMNAANAPEAQLGPSPAAESPAAAAAGTKAAKPAKATKKQAKAAAAAAAAAAAVAAAAAAAAAHEQQHQCSCKCVCHDGQFAARQQQQLQHMQRRQLLLEQQQLSWLQDYEASPAVTCGC